MEVVGGEYEIHLGASAGGRGEAGKGGDVGVKVGSGGGGDETDEGVVTAVAVTVEAAGDGMCSMRPQTHVEQSRRGAQRI